MPCKFNVKGFILILFKLTLMLTKKVKYDVSNV